MGGVSLPKVDLGSAAKFAINPALGITDAFSRGGGGPSIGPDLTGGSSAPSTSIPGNPYEAQLAAMAQALFNQTAPMRGNLINELTQVTNGTFDPHKSPIFSPRFAEAKQGVEDQYGIAKDNIMSNTARGGAMTSALNNLDMTRAATAARIPQEISGNIMTDMLNKAYGTAFNAPNVAMSGLGNAGQSLSGLQAMQMQADAAKASAKKGAQGQALSGGAAAFGYAMGS